MKKKLTIGISALIVIILALTFWGIQKNQPSHSTATSSSSSLVNKSQQKESSSSQTSSNTSSSSTSSSQDSKDEKKYTSSTQASESGFDIDKLMAGDYASLAGTWNDANGRTIIISPQGQASVLGTMGTISLARDGKGEPLMTITYDDGTSLAVLLYSAGNTIPSRHFQSGETDPSDTSKNRLVTPMTDTFDEGGTDAFKNQVLYKLSDDYSTIG